MVKFNVLKGLGGGLFAGAGKSLKKFLSGTPDQMHQVSTLRPEQEGLYNQLTQAGMAPGAGGAFGQSADYYRNLLGDNSQDYQSFANPALRQYGEEIIPGLSEQFAGMGSGGLGSSGFNLAQQQGAVDLAERLGQIRSSLRQSGAQGLQNIGQMGLGNFSTNVTQPGSPGLLASMAPAIGSIAGSAMGGPIGGAIGGGLGQGFGNWFGGHGNKVGQNTSPYGSMPKASPTMQYPGSSAFGGR